MLTTIFLILSAILLILTLAPVSRHEVWWVRGWDFPRMQLFILSIVLISIALLLLDLEVNQNRIVIGVNAFCIVFLGWWIIPYTIFYKTEVAKVKKIESDQVIKIMVANVLYSNRETTRLFQMINENQPHILVTLESNKWWEEQLNQIEHEYPFTIKQSLENSYGMHVYSKYELLETEINFLVEDDVPSMKAYAVLPSGQKVKIHFLHPAPPSPTENEESTERDAELLIIAKEVSKKDEPVIVTGDMNDVAWSFTTRLFRKISGLLDPRIGRGMFSTFHADYAIIRWPLDHLFHSYHFNVIQVSKLPHFGSDHFPILVTLQYTHKDTNKGNGLEPTNGDKEMAKEKIEKA